MLKFKFVIIRLETYVQHVYPRSFVDMSCINEYHGKIVKKIFLELQIFFLFYFFIYDFPLRVIYAKCKF